MDEIKDAVVPDELCKGAHCPCDDRYTCINAEKFEAEEFVISEPAVDIDSCSDYELFNVGAVNMASQGRLLELKLCLKNVCPRHAVAVGVLVHELDQCCNEHIRGFKAIKYPGHNKPFCRDVSIKGIRFVLPEADDASGGPDSICNKRRFRVRVIANYITSDVEVKC